MKARLLYRDRDFDGGELPWNEPALVQDLELGTLLAAMAAGDDLVRDVARRALLVSCREDVETILYRQAIARDAVENPAALRELYGIAVEAIDGRRRRSIGIWGHLAASVLYDALEMMEVFTGALRRLRDAARAHAPRFRSEGFRNLFAMLERDVALMLTGLGLAILWPRMLTVVLWTVMVGLYVLLARDEERRMTNQDERLASGPELVEDDAAHPRVRSPREEILAPGILERRGLRECRAQLEPGFPRRC